MKNTRVGGVGQRSEIVLLGGQSPVAAATHDSRLRGMGKKDQVQELLIKLLERTVSSL